MSTFAIVNLRDGTRKDLVPFLLENDAFPILENAYLFRGRIQRRSCFSRLGTGKSRLRWQIGTTDVAGDFSTAVPPAADLQNAPLTPGISQFGVGTVYYTDWKDTAGGDPITLLSSGAGVATLDRAGANPGRFILLGGPANTAVFYYPGLPVMGLRVRELTDISDEALIAFDTKYSYQYDNGTQDFIGANTYKTTSSVFIWHGTNSDFFWSTNYYTVFWATNNVVGLNAYSISNGTNAIPSVITIGVGHNLVNGDVVMIANTQNSTTLNGRTFLVQNSNSAAGTIEINNTVLPGAAYASGYVIVLNRSVNTIAGTVNGDGIKWYDGTGWVNFVAPLNAATPQRLLRGGLIIVAYKDRLVVLNTHESTGTNASVNFPQRARWCQNGTPFFTEDNAATPVEYLLPTNQSAQFDAWFDGTPGKGGFIDAPTSEQIISAEFLKDTLVVYFERSTWQLVYTNNEFLPFVWQKINTELGCESTFSVVPFDSGVFAVGNYGIISTDTTQVQRIDQKIPDEVFQIQNIRNGVKRVAGIRDYNAQLVYWTYPIVSDEDGDTPNYPLTYPNQVLVYNYLDGSWAEFDDCFTCFGYWQEVQDLTWDTSQFSWESAAFPWNSQVTRAKYPDVVAGNQRGFVFVYSQLKQLGRNVSSLEISNITVISVTNATITIPDHNLVIGDYVMITDAVGVTNFNGRIFEIKTATINTFGITTPVGVLPFSGTYAGAGFITHIPNFVIQTKQFNPYYQQGDGVRLNYVDFYCDRTTDGEFTAQFYTNSNVSQSMPNSDADPTLPQNPVVLTSPESATAFSGHQDQIFHRVYTNAFGAFFQNVFTLSDEQITDPDVSASDVTIHGLIYYVSPAGRVSYDI